MTPEQQRIKLAEWDGKLTAKDWSYIKSQGKWWIEPRGIYFGTSSQYHGIPNYPFDLNAVHELEKKLTAEQWYEYDRLIGFVLRDPQKIHATAAQRCEALLKTLGLWEEAK